MHTLSPQDFQRWQLDLKQVCGHFDARRSAAAAHFYGSANRLQFGDLEFARIQSNAASIARGRRRGGQADPYCFLVLQVQGTQHLAVDRLEPVEMQPGDLMLLDPAIPFEMLPHGFVDNISVHLPRALVKAQIPGRHLTGKLARDVVSTRLLRGLINQVSDTEPAYHASATEAQGVRQSLLALLGAAIRPTEPETSVGLFDAAALQVAANLASFDLTPDWLADRLGVSRRQLYRAFAAADQPGAARFILEHRLERAAALLRSEQARAQPIGVVALEVGLADLAHFSRAFRRRFSQTPSQFRALETS